MVTLEIRRHAERATGDGAGSGLSPAGLAMARSLRRETGAFALVVSSTKARARDTAVAIAGRVDEVVDALSVSPDEALTQEQYDTMTSQEDVIQLIGAQRPSLRFAQAQRELWESMARRLRPGERALIITHGGNVELPAALVARGLAVDIGPLPLGYCDGVRVHFNAGRWRSIERLYADPRLVTLAERELPLGGNVSASVKVGDTVRRRTGAWTPAIHALLRHLQNAGFTAAPRSLGTDDHGRAVLSFIPGDVHGGWPEPMPSWMREDQGTLIAAAELLRRYHDAVASFDPPPNAQWRFVSPGDHEVICHNDWAPYNALFEGHRPVAMLDWDSAGPGTRLWDVALSAYTWVPLYPKTSPIGIDAQMARLARLCEAYGNGMRPSAVLGILPTQLRYFAGAIQASHDAGDTSFKRLIGWNVPARLREDADLVARLGERSP